MISAQLLEAIVNYMSTKPYKEVHVLIHTVQRELAQQQEAPQPEEEKGE